MVPLRGETLTREEINSGQVRTLIILKAVITGVSD